MKFRITKASGYWNVCPPFRNVFQDKKGDFEDWFINIDSIDELVKIASEEEIILSIGRLDRMPQIMIYDDYIE